MKSCYVCAKPSNGTFCPSCQPQPQVVAKNGPVPLPQDISDMEGTEGGLSGLQLTYDVAKKEAKTIREVEAKGFKVIRSTPKTLLLDLDNAGAINKFCAMIGMVQQAVPVKRFQAYASKSSTAALPRWHVIVELVDSLDIERRLFLQQVLGDDPRRGVLSYRKLIELDIEEPCLLFQPPDAVYFDPVVEVL